LLTFKVRLSWSTVEIVLVPALATLVTGLTGFVLAYSSTIGYGEISQYGLPLFWRTFVEYPGYVGRFGVSSPVSFTTYSSDVFILDVLLYAGIGYLIVLWRRGRVSLFRTIIIPVSSAWLACATAFFPWSSQYQAWTNGLPIPWMGFFLSRGWTYDWIGLASDVAIIAALEYFAFFLYRGFRIKESSSLPVGCVVVGGIASESI
jgi:hypothetical protein